MTTISGVDLDIKRVTVKDPLMDGPGGIGRGGGSGGRGGYGGGHGVVDTAGMVVLAQVTGTTLPT